MPCASGGLSAPEVEISDIAFSSFHVNWTFINNTVDNWRVLILNADDEVTRVSFK